MKFCLQIQIMLNSSKNKHFLGRNVQENLLKF